jgi:hypothetical protein
VGHRRRQTLGGVEIVSSAHRQILA